MGNGVDFRLGVTSYFRKFDETEGEGFFVIKGRIPTPEYGGLGSSYVLGGDVGKGLVRFCFLDFSGDEAVIELEGYAHLTRSHNLFTRGGPMGECERKIFEFVDNELIGKLGILSVKSAVPLYDCVGVKSDENGVPFGYGLFEDSVVFTGKASNNTYKINRNLGFRTMRELRNQMVF